jgi:hypothetical protein
MAIAIDATTNGGIVTNSTFLNWNHTCSGSNRLLIVAAFGNNQSNSLASCTYNGVTMSLLGVTPPLVPGDRCVWLWSLVAPATGTNACQINTASGVIDAMSAISASYTGAAQTGQPESAEADTGSSANPCTTSHTLGTAAWIIGVFKQNGAAGTMTSGTNATVRLENASGVVLVDSNGVLTSGAKTLTVTPSGSTSWAWATGGFVEASGGGATAPSPFLLLGAG